MQQKFIFRSIQTKDENYCPGKKKWRWHDGEGKQLTAGGILPYDKDGFWVIGEIDKNKVVYTDIGGRYEIEDGDIYATISREIQEELYYTCEITRSQVIDLTKKNTPVYVNGHQSRPVYICYPIHVQEIYNVTKMNKFPFLLNPDTFMKGRKRYIDGNPYTPKSVFKQVELKYIKFEDVQTFHKHFSYRLKRILKYGLLRNMCYTSESDKE